MQSTISGNYNDDLCINMNIGDAVCFQTYWREKKKREVFESFIQQIIMKRTTYERPHAVDRRATAP